MAHLQLESYPNLSLKSGTSSTGIRTSFLLERVAHHQLVYPVTAPQLYKWRKEYEEFGQGSFPGNGNLKQTPEQERITELEIKLKDAELERDILKKAIGIFSKNGR
ncbi:hypothetical protein SAMN05443667_11517 [Flavobacterium gillisiae]|uniref:Transposase n=1 Tax=Flavobacterium gillisiae TaxID=150146 RepID=A0A1H4FU78_9FLAO|nr:hypothetical protein [Flavobacterium gillisiae]SEB00909.1 hypothetical protein SAMN05443667_11517 [Flavobacterium gillisiae]